MKNFPLFLLCGLAAATLVTGSRLDAQRNDMRAGYLGLFSSTGPNAARVHLRGGSAPVIGRVASMQVEAAGYDFAAMILTQRATQGRNIAVGGHLLTSYSDPLSFLASFALPLRQGRGLVQLALPNDRRFAGVDLAWQAIVFSGDLRRIGMTNLLLGNVGLGAAAGGMVFANLQVKNITLKPGQCYDLPYSTGVAATVTVCGTRSNPKLPLEARVNGVKQTTIAPDKASNQTFWTTVSVPAKGTISICNPKTNKKSVNITITSVAVK